MRLCNAILLNAIKKGASDIHIEPYEKMLRVRYRIDGVLHDEMHPPLKLKNAISSRFKIMASLDIAERRLPQDGRIKLKLGKGREMDFRVNVPADALGREDLHALARQGQPAARHDEARLRAEAAQGLQVGDQQAFGMVLVTGPTGSGKTTTLYSALSRAEQDRRPTSPPPRIRSSTT